MIMNDHIKCPWCGKDIGMGEEAFNKHIDNECKKFSPPTDKQVDSITSLMDMIAKSEEE